MTGTPRHVLIARVAGVGLVAALVRALVVDQGRPAPTRTPPAATIAPTATVPAARLAQAPPRVTPTPRTDRSDRKAERRRERRRSRRSRGWVAAQHPTSGTRSAPVSVPDPEFDTAYLDELSEEAATTSARQYEQVREMIDAAAAARHAWREAEGGRRRAGPCPRP